MEKKGEGRAERGGIHTGVHRFMALTSASFSTHCSEPVCHAPLHHHLPAFAISLLVSSEKGRESLGGGTGKKTDSFSLDVLQWEACRDTFKDEVGVNVVGRMTEPL